MSVLKQLWQVRNDPFSNDPNSPNHMENVKKHFKKNVTLQQIMHQDPEVAEFSRLLDIAYSIDKSIINITKNYTIKCPLNSKMSANDDIKTNVTNLMMPNSTDSEKDDAKTFVVSFVQRHMMEGNSMNDTDCISCIELKDGWLCIIDDIIA